MSHIPFLSSLAACILLAGSVAADPAEKKSCDFKGPYSGSCVSALASGRPGGLLIITANHPGRSCESLSDTARYAADTYCVQNDISLQASMDPAIGGVPHTCDGTADDAYETTMADTLGQLVLDGTAEVSASGPMWPFPTCRMAPMKFICVAR